MGGQNIDFDSCYIGCNWLYKNGGQPLTVSLTTSLKSFVVIIGCEGLIDNSVQTPWTNIYNLKWRLSMKTFSLSTTQTRPPTYEMWKD